MERFLAILEKNPRKSVALDRVYGYHVEHGTLEAFVQTYRQRTKNNPNDGHAWFLLGLIESQRGNDAAAVEAFRQAERLLPDNPLASYYLAQSLVLVGQPEQAVQALERAIQRHPQRADLLEFSKCSAEFTSGPTTLRRPCGSGTDWRNCFRTTCGCRSKLRRCCWRRATGRAH